MPYATPSDIESALGTDVYREVSIRDADGVVDSSVVSAAIAAASSLADSYLTKWLPITVVPDALRDAVVAIAVQKLRLPRDMSTEDSRRAYDAAMAWLRDVSKGTASLGLPVPADPEADGPWFDEVDRQFSRSSLRGVL